MKRIISVALALMFMTLIPLATANNGEHHIDEGMNWNAPYPYQGYFCMCTHMGPVDFGSADTWTGVGLSADYDTINQIPYYRTVHWMLEAASMGQYDPYGSLQGDTCVNYYSGQNCYDGYNWEYSLQYYCNRAYIDITGGPWTGGEVYSAEGSALAGFYDPNNPTNIWYSQSYTYPWDYLTAHS